MSVVDSINVFDAPSLASIAAHVTATIGREPGQDTAQQVAWW